MKTFHVWKPLRIWMTQLNIWSNVNYIAFPTVHAMHFKIPLVCSPTDVPKHTTWGGEQIYYKNKLNFKILGLSRKNRCMVIISSLRRPRQKTQARLVYIARLSQIWRKKEFLFYSIHLIAKWKQLHQMIIVLHIRWLSSEYYNAFLVLRAHIPFKIHILLILWELIWFILVVLSPHSFLNSFQTSSLQTLPTSCPLLLCWGFCCC